MRLFKVNLEFSSLAIFCIFVLTACAVRTPVERIPASELRQNLKYENVIFKKFDATSGVPSPEVPLATCKASAMSYLKGKEVLKRVEEDSESSYDEPTLFVEATLTNLRIVSGAARTWGGAFAGRSHMFMDVKLTDASTGSAIAQKELKGAPNAYGSAWSGGDSDRNLPYNMGILLGDFILANVSAR